MKQRKKKRKYLKKQNKTKLLNQKVESLKKKVQRIKRRNGFYNELKKPVNNTFAEDNCCELFLCLRCDFNSIFFICDFESI